MIKYVYVHYTVTSINLKLINTKSIKATKLWDGKPGILRVAAVLIMRGEQRLSQRCLELVSSMASSE